MGAVAPVRPLRLTAAAAGLAMPRSARARALVVRIRCLTDLANWLERVRLDVREGLQRCWLGDCRFANRGLRIKA